VTGTLQHVPGDTDPEALARRAHAAGQRAYIVPPAYNKAQLLAGFAWVFDFPSYFGHNLDALADCLSDLWWLPEAPVALIWDGAAAFRQADPGTYAAVITILRDRVGADGPRPLHVTLVYR
jgi:RNAse (barnase) inhibitor barstar